MPVNAILRAFNTVGIFMQWLGFLPILAFVVLDSWTSKASALWGALALGIGELAFTLIRFHTIDYLSIIAFLILVVFVILSIKTKNDFYFKIQGALVNILFAVVMLAAWYGFHKALMLDMGVKYMGIENIVKLKPELTRELVTEMLRLMSQQLPWWLIVHSVVTIYAAANWGKWVWVFVRIPGFFLMLFFAANIIGAQAMINVR